MAAAADTANAELELVILGRIHSAGGIADTWALAEELGVDHQRLVGAVKSLESDEYVVSRVVSRKFWVLLDDGLRTMEHGSGEVQLARLVPPEGIAVADLQAAAGELYKFSFGPALKGGLITKDKDSGLLFANVRCRGPVRGAVSCAKH